MPESDELAPPQPKTWKVIAFDLDVENVREGVELPVDWEPFAVVMRGSVPVAMLKAYTEPPAE